MEFEPANGGGVIVPFPNGCRLRFAPGPPGLRALVLETPDLAADRRALEAAGTPTEPATDADELRVPASVTGFEILLRASNDR